MEVLRKTFSPPAKSWPATCCAKTTKTTTTRPTTPKTTASRAGRPRIMPGTKSIPIALVQEGQRMMSICNACRYCEGYCAVFPALERRLRFDESDLNYLAILCHNCGACYSACQYAPPHEFNLY